ncbi:N-acyl-D-amino-acid deacylase family protein [Agromyces silvae]|uniref:N-acyl-D-amino-acid deacylase family protein n=1 Tax=Agromyces silvae TaxID=3388266 RepID=UPI00280BB221|nr:amidohydrolase family protein [Agromyces protaetiae]
MLDVLIRGGQLIDGTGRSPRVADIGILGDRVALVGSAGPATAREVVDATGMLVTPGLIDPHSHSDWSILGNRDALSTIHQGVTTEVVGNCGVTHAPIAARDVAATRATLAAYGYDGPVEWRGFGDYLDRVHASGTAQNLMWFVGHTALRQIAMADADEGADFQRSLERHLAEALDAGAIGFSSGLEYGAGRFAGTDELASLARVMSRHGGMYASHIRNRDAHLRDAVDEFFRIVHAGEVKAQLSHLNVRHNTGADAHAWTDAVERLLREREQGVDVLADMTPYPDGIGLATGLLPAWLADRGAAEASELLSDPEIRDRVRRDGDRYWRFVHRGEWGRVRLAVSPATPELEGLTFPQIAQATGKDEWESYFDVLAAAGPDMGAVQFIGELFQDDHIAEAVAHDDFLLGVDGYTSRRDGPLADRTRHPLFFHGYLHFLSYHAIRRSTLPLEAAIHKMTGAVAQHFAIADRGTLVEGNYADVVVFDTDALHRVDTFTMPDEYATAARHVWVNGAAAVHDGVRTNDRSGRRLDRKGS